MDVDGNKEERSAGEAALCMKPMGISFLIWEGFLPHPFTAC